MTPDADLDALVRRVDEDRWLASRFTTPDRRADLMAFYALNHEIALTAERVSEAGIGDIRLAWWREAVAEIYAGGSVRAHPALTAYAQLARDIELPREPLDALIEARGKDLEPAPFADWAELDAYLDATAGNVMRLALAICGGEAEPFVREGARAWGYTGLIRAHAFWKARGRTFLPRDGGTLGAIRVRARQAYAEASALSHKLPPAAFPAIGYVTLVPAYRKAMKRGRELSLWSRQWRLVFASARGGV